ncbi:MAG: hypothetical protein WA110_08415 [Anaerolineaceae bacterium]
MSGFQALLCDFELFFKLAQGAGGVCHRGLVDQHGLRAAFEGWVLPDALAVFVDGDCSGAVPCASMGLWMMLASMAPSAALAPKIVCSSSTGRMIPSWALVTDKKDEKIFWKIEPRQAEWVSINP